MAVKEETSFKRTIRRQQLRQMVPLADSTIYEMEQRGEFPRRFALSPRCVVWDLSEVEACSRPQPGSPDPQRPARGGRRYPRDRYGSSEKPRPATARRVRAAIPEGLSIPRLIDPHVVLTQANFCCKC